MDVDRTSMQLENQNKEELGLKDRARCVCVCVCVRERGQGKQTAETRREETLRYKANRQTKSTEK